ncbi:MAG: PH domain-containing protein [Lachnospiraceae bacterium]|nr:PH domain-containing protein [Lachnospiraceae bacterium]
MEFVERKRTVFLGLPICFTKYCISEEKINVKTGLLNTTEDDAYMYKVQDVRLKRSLFERLVGIGTVVCYTGDITHPELKIEHVKNAEAIKDFIMKTSEEARLKRRTIHTMDIDGDGDHLHA